MLYFGSQIFVKCDKNQKYFVVQLLNIWKLVMAHKEAHLAQLKTHPLLIRQFSV